MIRHATIIPLIGGEVLASSEVFSSKPDYILSYDTFQDNEKHLLNYWNYEVPYYILDKPKKSGDKIHQVDVVSSVCPCAGLSQYSSKYGSKNENNQWLTKSANFVLKVVKPKVFWGENAYGLPGKIGQSTLKEMKEIANHYGYSVSIYRTRNLLHGVAQVRNRSFYFFWKGDKVPLLNYYKRHWEKIEDVILSTKTNFQTEVINKKVPTEDPYYKYLLEVVYNGISHTEFQNIMVTTSVRNNDVSSFIEKAGHTYKQIGEWMKIHSTQFEVDKCFRRHEKLASGGEIMRRGTTIPKDYIGAFIGYYPLKLTHPKEDRYINFREAMNIMGLPKDFELLNPKQSVNHICQNVHYLTAKDISFEVKEALLKRRNFIKTDYLVQNNITQRIENNEEKENTLDKLWN